MVSQAKISNIIDSLLRNVDCCLPIDLPDRDVFPYSARKRHRLSYRCGDSGGCDVLSSQYSCLAIYVAMSHHRKIMR